MKSNKISVNETIQEVKTLLEQEKNISPALKAAIKMMIVLMDTLTKQSALNSQNSSKPQTKESKEKQ